VDTTWAEDLADEQRDSRFIDWLAAMPDRLAEFRAGTLPYLTADPHSREAIEYAEERLAQVFPNREEMYQVPGAVKIVDGFARFIGEAYVHLLGGRWMAIPRTSWTETNRSYSIVIGIGDEVRSFEMIPTINGAVRNRGMLVQILDRVGAELAALGIDPAGNGLDLAPELDDADLPEEQVDPDAEPNESVWLLLPTNRAITRTHLVDIVTDRSEENGLVVSTRSGRVDAASADGATTISFIIEGGEFAAEDIAGVFERHRHPRADEFAGSLNYVDMFVDNDSDEGFDLSSELIAFTEIFEREFGAISYLPNVDRYFDPDIAG
jgi:hypothetical protein